MKQHDSIETLFESYGERYRYRVVSTLILGVVSVLLTGTSINVVIPVIIQEMAISQSVAQWLATTYLAASTIVMLATAWLIGALGERKLFLTASLIFVISSILAFFSSSIEMLIFARIVQGCSSGVFLPLAIVTLLKVFPIERHGYAMGIFTIGAVFAPSFGPTLAGFFVDYFSWRSVFLLSLPLTFLALPLALRYLPEKDPKHQHSRFDWFGLFLISFAVAGGMIALTNYSNGTLSTELVLLLGGLALLSFMIFIYHQLKDKTPLLDLTLFKHRGFLFASLVNLSFGISVYASTFLIPLMLQSSFQFSATDAGLILLPAGLFLGFASPIAGHISDRSSPALVTCIGILLFAYSCYLMTEITLQSSFILIATWVVIGRIGLGMVFPAVNALALSPLPNELRSQGSGASNFIRQLGGAFGVNLISIYLGLQTASYYQGMENSSSISLVALFNPESVNNAELFNDIGQKASYLSYQDSFLIMMLMSLITLIPALFMFNIARR